MPVDYRHIVRDLLEDDRSDVISLYLPVDATDSRNQRAHGDEWWRAEARSLVRDLERDADGDKARRNELAAAVEQLDAFTEGYVPSERSVAVFADADGVRSLPMEIDIAGGDGQGIGTIRNAADTAPSFAIDSVQAQ